MWQITLRLLMCASKERSMRSTKTFRFIVDVKTGRVASISVDCCSVLYSVALH